MDDFFIKAIQKLKNEREIFHSEDDLKFELALKIRDVNSDFKIRLERPNDIKMEMVNGKIEQVRAPIDIIVINGDKTIPIELKYKTKKLKCNNDDICKVNGEVYDLKKHGATNIGRYSFRKDIYRIEQYLSNNENNSNYGFVFILTNENKYFDDNVAIKNTLDRNFSCHEGYEIEKEYKGWNYSKIDKSKDPENKHWTTKGQTSYKLELKNSYIFNWHIYSEIKKNTFKYCVIKVNKQW